MKKIIAILLVILTFSLPMMVHAEDAQEDTRGGHVYEIAQREIFSHEGTTLPYRYILPEDYNTETAYPLVVFLHAEPERGNDNISQLRHGVNQIVDRMPGVIILAPQCDIDNQWVDTPVENGSYSIAEVAESNELRAVVALISKMKTDFKVDEERVYAIGASMGGYGVWDLVMRHNELFAAGIVLSGAGDPTQAEALKNTPMYVFHGVKDEVITLDYAREMVQKIYDVGSTKVRYFEIANATHEIYYELWWGYGVMDTLTQHRNSDKNIIEEENITKPVEQQEVSNEKQNVVDAGVVDTPSVWEIVIFVVITIILLYILVINVIRRKI